MWHGLRGCGWAYPRSRGGTMLRLTEQQRLRGLSPLARGNHQQLQNAITRTGPIPARAGEPKKIRSDVSVSGAYPRSRGGTFAVNVLGVSAEGLSPLARGNRYALRDTYGFSGPIPARAGEPRIDRH